MKHNIVLISLIIAALLAAISVSADIMTGSWETVPAEASPLPEEAQTAFEKAMENLVGEEYTPVTLLAKQIAAGTNYCILCQVKPVVPDSAPAWALVYFCTDPAGNSKIMNVYELYIDRHAYPAE